MKTRFNKIARRSGPIRFVSAALKDPLKMTILLASAGLLGLIIWAHHAQLNEVVTASGQVVANARTQTVQAADPGVIAEILIKEGQHVDKGQLLVRLDRDRSAASFADSKAKVAALRAQLTRLNAEVFGRPLAFSAELRQDYPAFVGNQGELFSRRQTALTQAVHALQASLLLVKAELATVQPLVKSGDVGQAEVLRLQRAQAEIDGQIVNLRNKYFQEAQVDMTKAEEDLHTREQELADRSALLEHTELLAPMSGLIKSLSISTVGADVRPGETLIQIVPDDGGLTFEAKLKPADVAFVHVGEQVSVKLDPYDYSIYGALNGKVVYVSADSITEDTRRGEEIYYRIRIDFAPVQSPAGHKKIVLQPGMTGKADIRTGDRTVLSYFTKPVTKTLSESMHER